MSLSRGTDDPALKQRYEDLAIEFAQNIDGGRDLDMTTAPLASILKAESGDTSSQ